MYRGAVGSSEELFVVTFLEEGCPGLEILKTSKKDQLVSAITEVLLQSWVQIKMETHCTASSLPQEVPCTSV